MATPGAFDFFEKLIAENESKNRASGNSPAPEAQGAAPANPLPEVEVLAPAADPAPELPAPEGEGGSRESSPSVQNVGYSLASAKSLVDASKPPLHKSNSAEIIDAISAIEVQRKSVAGGIGQIEVVDGLALLNQPSGDSYAEEEGRPSNVPRSEDSDDDVGFSLEMDVEEGKELPPSPKKQKGPRRAATMTNLQNARNKHNGPAQWFQDNKFGVKISHRELMVGGPIPKSGPAKDDLIQRLRMFINRLNTDLSQSEEQSKLLKRKFSKKAEEVKESEELVRTLTGRLTEQATVVAVQMKEVQEARREGPRDKGSDEAIAAVAAAEAREAAESGIGRPDSMRNVLAAAAQEGESARPNQGLQRSMSHQELMKSQQMLINNILPADSFPGFTYKLTIKAPPMGFTLRKDEGGRYAKVASISRNDLKKAGLVPGLQLLSVNGASLSNMSLQEIKGVLDTSSMPAEIRMRRALSPWTRYQEYTTTKWKTKKAINTWTFYCSRSKPRIIVLEHNQRTVKGKGKRKITIDGEIRYQRKSSDESFKFHLDSDVIYLKIGKNSQGAFKYTLRINELTFDEAKTNFLIMRSEIV